MCAVFVVVVDAWVFAQTSERITVSHNGKECRRVHVHCVQLCQSLEKGTGTRWRYFSRFVVNRMPSMCVCVSTRSACEGNRDTCLDVQAEARGCDMRWGGADRAGGSVPGGIQTAFVLCDQDGDGFIRPVTLSFSPSLSLSGCKDNCKSHL